MSDFREIADLTSKIIDLLSDDETKFETQLAALKTATALLDNAILVRAQGVALLRAVNGGAD